MVELMYYIDRIEVSGHSIWLKSFKPTEEWSESIFDRLGFIHKEDAKLIAHKVLCPTHLDTYVRDEEGFVCY